MKIAGIAGVALVLSLASVESRQAPDLSGTWVASDAMPPAVQRAPTPAFGERFAIRQSAEGLTLVRPTRGTTSVVTLPPFMVRAVL